MIAPRTAGFMCFQSSSPLVTEMKSEPKKTRLTPGTANRALASGERAAASRVGKSATVPSPMTSRPGRNFSVAGLGVDSVWMNIAWLYFGAVPRSYMDLRAGPIKRRAVGAPNGLKIRGDPLPFPVAITGGFGALGAIELLGAVGGGRCRGAAGVRLRQGPFGPPRESALRSGPWKGIYPSVCGRPWPGPSRLIS